MASTSASSSTTALHVVERRAEMSAYDAIARYAVFCIACFPGDLCYAVLHGHARPRSSKTTPYLDYTLSRTLLGPHSLPTTTNSSGRRYTHGCDTSRPSVRRGGPGLRHDGTRVPPTSKLLPCPRQRHIRGYTTAGRSIASKMQLHCPWIGREAYESREEYFTWINR